MFWGCRCSYPSAAIEPKWMRRRKYCDIWLPLPYGYDAICFATEISPTPFAERICNGGLLILETVPAMRLAFYGSDSHIHPKGGMNNEKINGRFICRDAESGVLGCAGNFGSPRWTRWRRWKGRISWRLSFPWRKLGRPLWRISWWLSRCAGLSRHARFSGKILRLCSLLRLWSRIPCGLLVEWLLLYQSILRRVPKMDSNRRLSHGKQARPQYRRLGRGSGARWVLGSCPLQLALSRGHFSISGNPQAEKHH